MSTDIRVGDTVKVTFEAEVIKAGPRELYIDAGKAAGTIWVAREHADVEKVEPPVEAFGPGDVVRNPVTGQTYTLAQDGWIMHYSGARFTCARTDSPMSQFTSEDFERVDLS